MDILFLGDSITEGVPGVSYVEKVSGSNKNWNTINRGKGGDTVLSLYKRVLKMNDLDSFDHIVLFVGVNDIYGKLTKSYKVLKALKRQRAAKNNELFKRHYKVLVEYLIHKNKNILIIPPLLIGEDYDNMWNNQIFGLVEIVKEITQTYHAEYLDIYTLFKSYLVNEKVSNYLPLKIMDLVDDVNNLKTIKEVDLRSKERNLHLTLDGVHINSKGAEIISNKIINSIIE